MYTLGVRIQLENMKKSARSARCETDAGGIDAKVVARADNIYNTEAREGREPIAREIEKQKNIIPQHGLKVTGGNLSQWKEALKYIRSIPLSQKPVN